MEWDVVIPLVQQGKMPNVKRLMERGTYGYLKTFRPTQSPIIWTSVVTGKEKQDHGIRGFTYEDSEGQQRLYNNGDRKTKALWNILSDYDRTVCSVGWWMTHPVEEVNGVMVAQTNTTAQIETEYGKNIWKGTLLPSVPKQVFPPERQEEVLAVLDNVDQQLPDLTQRIFGRFRSPLTPLGQRLWENCMWAFRADATYLRVVQQLTKEKPPYDLTLVYFGGTDVVGHRFWRYSYPELFDHPPSEEQIQNLSGIIPDYYAYADSLIGSLVQQWGPNATVLILSDHGMKAFNLEAPFDPNDPPLNVNSAHHNHAPPGVILAAGPCIRRSRANQSIDSLQPEDLPPIASVYDITPTILAMLRIPVGKDMKGRILQGLFVESFTGLKQPQLISTHDTSEFLAGRTGLNQDDSGMTDERLEQLRDLGYIGN